MQEKFTQMQKYFQKTVDFLRDIVYYDNSKRNCVKGGKHNEQEKEKRQQEANSRKVTSCHRNPKPT